LQRGFLTKTTKNTKITKSTKILQLDQQALGKANRHTL